MRGHRLGVSLKVALVSHDADARLALVKAFDNAPTTWLLSLDRVAPADADIVVCGSDVEIPGAVIFDPDEPDNVVAQVAQRAVPSARCVVITSPSGGTGVTSIAVHVAAEMAARGLSTCVVDLDGPWGIRPRLGLDDAEVEAAVPVAGGFRLLDARSAARDHRRALLASTMDSSERVIVDASTDGLSAVADVARRSVLVVSPTPDGTRRAAAVLEAHPGFEWVVALNRPGPGGETTRAAIAHVLERAVEIELPCYPGLRDSEDSCRLLARGWSRWSRGIARLVSLLER